MAYIQHFDGRREEVDDVVEEVGPDGKPTGRRRVAKVVTTGSVSASADSSDVAETKASDGDESKE